MFVVPLKTLLVSATKETFDADYVEPDFRRITVSMEFPAAKTHYPSIWVDFTPTAPLQIAGIDHHEYVLDPVTGRSRRVTRWRYGGQLQLTVLALTSLERDRLVDEVVRVMSFGLEEPSTAVFRTRLESNDLVSCQVQWDRYMLEGKAETPGTAWGTDEVVYEQTVSVDCQGDFVARVDPTTATLVPLSSIVVHADTERDYVPPSDADGNGTWL